MIIDCHGHYTTEPKALQAFSAEDKQKIVEGNARRVFPPLVA